MDFINILQHNPWWKDPAEISNDAKIKEFNTAKIQWISQMKHYLKFNEDKIYTLRDPRQVGNFSI